MKIVCKLVIVICALFLSTRVVFAQIRVDAMNSVLNGKRLIIHVCDKSTGKTMLDEQVEEVNLHVESDRINLKKELITTGGGAKFNYATYSYEGIIPDSLVIEVKSPGFREERFVFYKGIHYVGMVAHVYISREDYRSNDLVVVGDRIKVTLGKDTFEYNAADFRQSKRENIVKTLCRLPGLEVEDATVKFNGQSLDYIFINSECVYKGWDKRFLRLVDQFKKYK